MAYATKKRKSVKAKKVMNAVKNTAKSKKKYKLVTICNSSKPVKSYLNTPKQVNDKIIMKRKTSRTCKWYLYSYRPSMKAYRLSKKSKNA